LPKVGNDLLKPFMVLCVDFEDDKLKILA
jgi:hypothetical protein